MLVYTHEKLAKLMLTNSELANFLQRYPIFLPTRLENAPGEIHCQSDLIDT